MSTCTPILASVPYSSLSSIQKAARTSSKRDIDDILDDLDSESDSGYDEEAPQVVKSNDNSIEQPTISIDNRTDADAGSPWFAPLVDGSPLCPEIASSPGEADSSASTSAPAWAKWTSSRVLCTDTVLATNEDRLDCVWLLAGCEDGTVWIFCSVFATTGVTENTGTSTPRSRAHSEFVHNSQSRSSGDRPPFRRQKSDAPASRKSVAPVSPSSTSQVSRAGPSSTVPSRIASTNHGRRHRSNAGSISLAIHGSASPSTHGGTHTPVGRKASATISITDLEALSNEATKEAEAPDRPTSPPFRTSMASMSFEELRPYEPVDHRQINFDPIAHVYPRASHSPIVSIKFLPQVGYTVPFVCLTANGQLFKFAVRDGMVIDHLDLGKALFPRSSHLSLSDCRFLHAPLPGQLLVKARNSGLLVSVDLSDLKVKHTLQLEPESHTAIFQKSGQTYLLEARANGQILVSPFSGRATSLELHEVGEASMPDGSAAKGIRVANEDVVVFSESHILILMIVDQRVTILRTVQMIGKLQDVLVLSARRLALVFEGLVRFMPVDEESDTCLLLDFALSEIIESATVLKQPTSTEDMLLLVTADADKSRAISVAPVQSPSAGHEPDMQVVYQSQSQLQKKGDIVPIAARQVDDATIVVGYSDGRVRFDTLKPKFSDGGNPLVNESSDSGPTLKGAITFLQVYATPKRVYAIAGSLYGMVGIWDAFARTPIAIFELFAAPVLTVCEMEDRYLAVGAGGSIAILLKEHIDDQPLLLPASTHPAERLYTRQSQLMSFYENGRARLWNLETGEMQKALSHVEAVDVISENEGWTDLEMPKRKCAPALSANFREVVEEATAAAIAASQTGMGTVHPSVRWLLSRHLVEPHEEYVKSALEQLDLRTISVPTIAFTSLLSATVFASREPRGALKITQRVSAERLLVTVALLRVFLNFTETERCANEAIAYYATTIGEEPEPGQKDVSLDYLADFWLDESNEIRQAARLLFGARVGRLTNSEVIAEVQERQAMMLRSSTFAAEALLVLGELAIARQTLLATGTLRDIAHQIVRAIESLDDLNCTCVALELCARGFSSWQNNFDAVRALRAIFKLAVNNFAAATNMSMSQTMISSIRGLARQAVLAAASVNAPLFMTVLSIDAIQSDVDPEERATTLKLIAFMVRKKPVVLFAHLPRLVDAVVRSLDPRGTLRGTLQQTATFILSELVKIYPSVDFHGKTQRLAVGTHEGACIVYDLKTATRLYILHSHHKRASAVSYSPDGRRLVTMSLEESNVKVWKVGTSLLGLLTPAGPPPQGHGSSSNEAYKTLEFKLASPEEAMMTAAAQLEWLTVDWLEERRVKISIRETALTFSVM